MTTDQVTGSEVAVSGKHRAIRTPLDDTIETVAVRVGGVRAKEVERFIKFGVVGTLGAIVDFGVLNLLQASVLPPGTEDDPNIIRFVGIALSAVAIASTISFVAAILSNFFWNRFWTYPDSRSRSIRRQLVQFSVVSVIGWVFRTIWISWSYAALGALVYRVAGGMIPSFELTAEGVSKLGSNVALMIGIFVVMIWNFFVNRYWTYNDVG